VPWLCDVVCFTSNVHPDEWWATDDVSTADRQAFAARCVIVQFDEVQEAAASRLASSRSALGADFARSLPANAREVQSLWLSVPPPSGRSLNLHVPYVPGAGGVPPAGLPLRPVQGPAANVPRALEDRLRLLQPAYAVTPIPRDSSGL